MFRCSRILILLVAVIASSSYATAFFLNWGGTTETTVKQQPQQWPMPAYYQQRVFQAGPSYTVQGPEQPVQIPAIPIQVPLQAQFSPAANVHNVQLVPCLCPVTQEFEYEPKPQETAFITQKLPQQ